MIKTQQRDSMKNRMNIKSRFMHKFERNFAYELSAVNLHMKVLPSTVGLPVLRVTCSCSMVVVCEEEADCGSKHIDL